MNAVSTFTGRRACHVVAGLSMTLVLGWAQAAPTAPATEPGSSPPAAEGKPLPAATPHKHKNSHAHRAPSRKPIMPERTPSRPLPPLPTQR